MGGDKPVLRWKWALGSSFCLAAAQVPCPGTDQFRSGARGRLRGGFAAKGGLRL
jgi:hypothetical protein